MTTPARSGGPLRIPAATWNKIRDLTNRLESSRSGLGLPSSANQWDSQSIIRVRNESTAPRRQWDVLGLAGPIVTPAQNLTEFFGLAMRGTLPNNTHRGKFCVLLQPLAPNAIGDAVIVGAVPVRLDEPLTFEAGQFADIEPGRSDKLKRGAKGVPVLWMGDVEADPTDGGQFRWAILNLTPGTGSNQTDPTCCGCSPTECFDFSTWDLVNDCPRLLALTVDEDIECCNGDAGGTHILEHTAAADGNPEMWRGPSFACGTEGTDCGSAVWTWSTAETCGSVTYTWAPAEGDCAISTANVLWTPGPNGNCGSGSWSQETSCGEGCEADLSGLDGYVPSNPCFPQTVTRQCVRTSGAWIASGECLCGTATEPPDPGDFDGQVISVPCEYEGEPGRWVLSDNDCNCGDPVRPEGSGTIQGEAVTTACVDPDSPAPDCGTATWQFFDCAGTTFIGALIAAEDGQPKMQWQLQSADCSEADPPCGEAPSAPPLARPVTVGQIATEPCELDGWELIEDECTCGDPIPPRAGLYHPHGTTLTRPCESPVLAYWRYLPASGYGPAEVQFLVDDQIRIRYRLPANRSYCCKCQSRWDILVGEPCEWPCRQIPQSVCLRPVSSGPAGGTCADYANAYSLTVDRLEMWPGPSPLKTPGLCEAQSGINDPGAPNNRVEGTFTLRLFVNLDEAVGGGNCWYLDEDWCYQTPTGCERPSLSTGWIKSPWSMTIPTGGSPKLLVTPRQYWDSAGDPHGPNTSDASAIYTLEDTLDDGSLLMRFPSGGGTEECYWPEYLLLIPAE